MQHLRSDRLVGRGRHLNRDLVLAAIIGYVKSRTGQHCDVKLSEILGTIQRRDPTDAFREAEAAPQRPTKSKSTVKPKRRGVVQEFDPDALKMWRTRNKKLVDRWAGIFALRFIPTGLRAATALTIDDTLQGLLVPVVS